jgi:glycoside/pentoside/hexuronide:cation symporter, GPH family
MTLKREDAAASRLPLTDKLLYASGSLGTSALFYGMTLWLMYFYAPPPGTGEVGRVPVWAVGLALGVGRVIETVDDPIIGWWSDRTQSRWGRRVPFLLFGTPLLAVTFALLWFPPVAGESLINAVYFFIALEAFFLINTIVTAPHEAIQAEIAVTDRDRVSVSAWKVGFGSAGAAVAMTLSPLLVRHLVSAAWGVPWVCLRSWHSTPCSSVCGEEADLPPTAMQRRCHHSETRCEQPFATVRSSGSR